MRSAYSFREFAAVGVVPDLASARCCVQPGGTMRLKTVVDIRLMVAVLGMALLVLTWFGLVQWFAGDLPD
jgi:predicted small integral membrane protein